MVIRTMDGLLVYTGGKEGLTAEQAAASAKDRNERAEAMGLKARYVVAPN